MFEIPAGGQRFRALELLVKQMRLAKNAQVPSDMSAYYSTNGCNRPVIRC
jgi:hypothetical protein